jgi:subtilisin
VAALANNPRIQVVEPDGIATINDAELDNTWGVKRIGAGDAHDATPPNTGAGIKVAVIDTGINYTHSDLAANYKGGYDFVNGDNDPMDDNGHGTHVSGTIAATNNDVGVVGVAPNAHLYGVKVLNASGSGSYSNIIAGVQWATGNGMQVTNNSYSGTGSSATLELAFANAAAAGVVTVAAASNSGNCAGTGDSVGYPAKYATVIAVAAIDSTDARACFSSTGPAVEIAAPGVQINSTILNGGYGSNWSGTSMASPHVVGAAALVIYHGVTDSNGNGRMNDEVRNILAMSASDLGAAGRDPLFGFGRVNIPAALAITSVPNALAVTSISYEAGTGRFNKDLFVTASAAYKPAVPQPGVAVSLTITLNNSFYKTVTGTTDSNGDVEIQIKSAPAGTYRTTVTAANVAGLTWDLATPTNSYIKK